MKEEKKMQETQTANASSEAPVFHKKFPFKLYNIQNGFHKNVDDCLTIGISLGISRDRCDA